MFKFKILLMTFVTSFITSAGTINQKLSVERLFQSPELDGSSVMNLQFSPDGNRLSFLKPKAENYEILDLWEYDLKTGQPKLLVDSNSLKFGELSEAEKARRERQRISQKGIIEYYWSNNGQRLVFPAAGELYLYDVQSKALDALTKGNTKATDVRFSPQDGFISFIQDQNLVIVDSKFFKKYFVTTLGKGPISYGVAEFIAQEEMHRFTGYWWSSDDKYLALTKTDESSVKLIERYDIEADKVVVHKERYPEAGSANAVVQLAVVAATDVIKGKTKLEWIPLGKNKDIYLANAKWNSDHKLIYQVQTRDQKRLDIFSPRGTPTLMALLKRSSLPSRRCSPSLAPWDWTWALSGSTQRVAVAFISKCLQRASCRGAWPPDGVASLPAIYRERAFSLHVDCMDMRVYSARKGRMWRVPNRQRANGRFKVPLALAEAQDVTPETYGALCSAPRAFPVLAAPTFAPGLGALWIAAKDKLARVKPRRNTGGALRQRFGVALPPSIAALCRGEIPARGGWNVIALQLGTLAHEQCLTEEALVTACKGLIERHQSDGSRYDTPRKREAELRRMFAYLDGNVCYSADVGGLRSILPAGLKVLDFLGLA